MDIEVTVQNTTNAIPAPSADDLKLLSMSHLLDAGYHIRANLPDKVDAVAHYLEQGWRQGLEPRDGFEGEFLRPYYEAVGFSVAPALTWLELLLLSGRTPPANRGEAAQLAEEVRNSKFFDARAYAKRLGRDLDPAMHYAIVGEFLGWPASDEFDAAFYLETYPDLSQAGLAPLSHYTRWGHGEGRRGAPAVNRLAFPPLPDLRRPVVLVVMHEASRTGAPVLGWNITKRLAEKYDVVTFLMRGGVLEEQFAAISAAMIGPMTWQDWQAAEMSRVAARLVATYGPIYAITNSVETNLLVPALAQRGVPCVALIHEFASYTRPLWKMRNVLDWATHVVFPAQLVAQSTYDAFSAFERRRGIHILSQGHAELPSVSSADTTFDSAIDRDTKIAALVRPPDATDAFIVLGAGFVHLRKGIDLFIATAAYAQRLAPDTRFRFVWIGNGYDPTNDVVYSPYLAEQIARSGVSDIVTMLDEVENLDPAYANADVFFLSSRLDPQPNVGIDAVMRGIPTICFDGACGTSEILLSDPKTRSLVVPYLDAHAAAKVICNLAKNPTALAKMRDATAHVGAKAYNMDAYVRQIDDWGTGAALHAEDLETLVGANVIDADLALPPGVTPVGAMGLERYVLQQWAVVGTSREQVSNLQFRRPVPGFHPQVYATFHLDECGEGGANPLAHWLRAGKPKGPWSRQVFSPGNQCSSDLAEMRVALHIHFYHVRDADDLAKRVGLNRTQCDLFVSTDTEIKAERLRSIFANHRGSVEVRVMPNLGRDIGPFLTGFAHEILNLGYDMIGHVHGKQSTDEISGNLWREFLWDNLVGGVYPMMDLAAEAFSSQPQIGLLIAEDPHLVAWDKNRPTAEMLAARMGVQLPLDDFFDFPLGNMFWARPSALRPLLDLDLGWPDYPHEPVSYDGTILHALERILPFSTRRAGLEVAGLRAPGTTW